MARKRKQFRSAKMARRQARKRRSKISERRKKEFLWRGYSTISNSQVYHPTGPPNVRSLAIAADRTEGDNNKIPDHLTPDHS